VRGGTAASRRTAVVAAVSVVVADGIGAIPALTSGQTVSFLVGLAGRAAVLAGIAVAAGRAGRRDDAGAEPETTPGPQGAVPWWAVALLAALSIALVVVNWPGNGEEYLWLNSDRGWYVHRSWHDTAIVGSGVALLATLGARLARPLAGVVAGVGVLLLTKAAQVLGGGIAYDQRTRWICTALLAAGLVALVWYALRPRPAAEGWLHPVGAALVLAGATMIMVSDRAESWGTTWLQVTRGTSVLLPLVLTAVALPTLRRGQDPATRQLLLAAAVTAVLLQLVAELRVPDPEQRVEFAVAVAGLALILAGIGVAAVPRRSAANAPQP
jgi:hypothetical protein